MARQPNVDHIIQWNKRRGRSRIGVELLHQVDDLAQNWEKYQDDFFSDFVPMRLATITEVYVRETVRDVVNSSGVYLDRSESLIKNIRLDFSVLKNLQGNSITIGDLVAHSLSISSIDQIISVYETLIPGYKSDLSNAAELWLEDEGRGFPIISDVNENISVLSKLFQIRHIAAHEIPRTKTYSNNDVYKFMNACSDFLSATDWILVENLKGKIPRTQSSMNSIAGSDLQNMESELKHVISEVRKCDSINMDVFDRDQSNWEKYAESYADLCASAVAGGSMHPMVWASHKAEAVSIRIESLRNLISREEYDL